MRVVFTQNRRKRRWTEKEIVFLDANWGKCKVNTLAVKMNRSLDSILTKAQQLKLGPLTRDGYTLSEVARKSGYDKGTVKRAITELGLWYIKHLGVNRSKLGYKGQKPNHRWLFTDEEFIVISKYLETKFAARADLTGYARWGGQKPDKCTKCNSNNHRYASHGLCIRCYQSAWGQFGRPAACIFCNKSDSHYVTKGKCNRCYHRHRKELAALYSLYGDAIRSNAIPW